MTLGAMLHYWAILLVCFVKVNCERNSSLVESGNTHTALVYNHEDTAIPTRPIYYSNIPQKYTVRIINIRYTTCKYNNFTLEEAIIPKLASNYTHINMYIDNSEIGFIPTHAFPTPADFFEKGVRCKAVYGKIVFNNNIIKRIYPNALSNLPDFSFVNNTLEIIDENAFNNPFVENLNLINNNISDIDKIFGKMEKLKELLLAHNNIAEINHAFIDMPLLNTLNLSYNKISVMDLNMLSGLVNLKVLDVSHNHIVQLRDLAISIPKIKRLLMSFNQLQHLNMDMLEDLKNLREIGFDGNNFTCDKLVNYSRQFFKMNVTIITGSTRDGHHFHGIRCYNTSDDELNTTITENEENFSKQILYILNTWKMEMDERNYMIADKENLQINLMQVMAESLDDWKIKANKNQITQNILLQSLITSFNEWRMTTNGSNDVQQNSIILSEKWTVAIFVIIAIVCLVVIVFIGYICLLIQKLLPKLTEQQLADHELEHLTIR